MTAEEQLAAIRDLVARYAHVSGTRVLPLPKVVGKLVDDWATLVERQIEEDQQNADADAADAEFEKFYDTHTPEEVDARLRADGVDPETTRRWMSDFKRFMPMLFKAKDRADAAEAKLAALASPLTHPDPTHERIMLARSKACPVCRAAPGCACELWPEGPTADAREAAGNSLGTHYERFAASVDARVAEHDDRMRREGAAKEHAELQPLLWHPLRDPECKSCDGSGWIIFNNQCDCVDLAFKKLHEAGRVEGRAEAEEKYAKLKKEYDRVMDILFHAISGETTPHDEETDGKDFATQAAMTIREYGSRVGAMTDRIEADPYYRSRVEAYENMLKRIPEWHARWSDTGHAKDALAREAKNVLLGITAARAAGFPLASLEDRVMKLIDEEQKAESQKKG